MDSNTEGSGTAVGAYALDAQTVGKNNNAIGNNALTKTQLVVRIQQ